MADNSYDRFVWREASTGCWKRDIDEVEQFYASVAELYRGSGRMFFAMTGHVSLRIHKESGNAELQKHLLDSIRTAWKGLRFEQPAIASRIVYDVEGVKWKKVYSVAKTETELGLWVDKSCKIVFHGKSGTDFANADPPAPELPTLFLVPVDDDSKARVDIVLRSPHDIMDGIGTLHLLNRLIEKTAAILDGESTTFPFDGSEVSRLSPPFRVAANVPPSPTPEHLKRLAEMKKRNDKISRSGAEVLGFPFANPDVVMPGKHHRLARNLSQDQTKRLLTACKTAGVTVTHAFHTAMALALCDVQEHQDKARPVQYHTYILRNERPSCIDPYNTPQYATSVYHSTSSGRLVVDLTVPGKTDPKNQGSKDRQADFHRILKIIHDYYEEVHTDKEHYALAPYIWKSAIPPILPLPKDLSPLPVPPPKKSASVTISSMGLLDKVVVAQHGPIEVHNPWVTGEELGNGLGLFLATHRGELCLSAAYNEAWQSEEAANAFLERCEEIVFDCLK